MYHDRYKELVYYCRQYPKKEKDPQRKQENEIINRCAYAVGEKWYKALLIHVAYGVPYAHIDPVLLPTSNRNSFYKAKSQFFDLLDQLHR